MYYENTVTYIKTKNLEELQRKRDTKDLIFFKVYSCEFALNTR